jgi:hypothetical protein
VPTTTPARCAQAAAGRSLNQEKARFSVRQFGPQPVLYGDTEVPASLIAELQNSRKEALERLGGKKAQMMWGAAEAAAAAAEERRRELEVKATLEAVLKEVEQERPCMLHCRPLLPA